MVCHLESLQPRHFVKGSSDQKSVIKFVSESVLIRRACAYISRRFTSVFWRGFFFETQSAFLIGLESAEGYLLAVHDSPKTREIPKNNPNHDVFMGTLPSSRRGKRVTLFGGKDQGEGSTDVTNRRRPLEGSSNEALIQGNRKLKSSRKEVVGYNRSMNSRSGEPERECVKLPINQGNKRRLTSSTNSIPNFRKKIQREESARPEQDTRRFNLRPRRTDRAESRPSCEKFGLII
ncbi:hypothetical protein TNCV_1278961 [Trichonephila clavipes]|nr:hypothetical protein TNCV_1278961 [Trichonephila clavipes]